MTQLLVDTRLFGIILRFEDLDGQYDDRPHVLKCCVVTGYCCCFCTDCLHPGTPISSPECVCLKCKCNVTQIKHPW